VSKSQHYPFVVAPGASVAKSHTRLPCRAGVGLKPQHFSSIVENWPDIGFFEAHAENYLVAGGPLHHFLTRIRERYPLSIHGVGLSIGSEEPLDIAHLRALRALLNRYQPEIFSEHLAWSSHGGIFFNDLLPLPYDSTTLRRVCAHIDEAQEVLGRRLLLENPATYVEFAQSSYSEAAFIGEIVRRTGCGLLLDVNNAYVSCINHGREVHAFLAALPLQEVGEIHLAGFHRETEIAGPPLLIDHHGSAVDEAVWALYQWVSRRIGAKPTLVEWDNAIPSFARLAEEARRAESILSSLNEACESEVIS
jgi:uncharacterized protein